MAKRAVINSLKKYLNLLRENGLPVTGGVLYGSYARGEETPDSDIDLLVLSPLFDKDKRAMVGKMWALARLIDIKIEPVPVGEKRYETDNVSPFLLMARKEGIFLRVDETKEKVKAS